nr:hypothetical protein [Tanacetum cinerariifolium]
MERVLENGSWLIRLVSIIVNVWTSNSRLKKNDIIMVPVWVKLHNVPTIAYYEIGLSLITTKLGRPIMLHAYTSNMCLNSWGRNTYTRALIEVSNYGFMEVTHKHGKGKQNSNYKQIDGVRLTKPKPNYYYSKPVNVNGEASTSQPNVKREPSSPKPNNKGKDVSDLQKIKVISLRNSFDALMEKDKKIKVNNETWKASNDAESITDNSDSEEVENVFVEDNGKYMDDLVDDAQKKVEASLKKTPMKTSIWLRRKADSPKRNVVFSPETKVHYFDRDDDMGQAAEKVVHENAYSKNG